MVVGIHADHAQYLPLEFGHIEFTPAADEFCGRTQCPVLHPYPLVVVEPPLPGPHLRQRGPFGGEYAPFVLLGLLLSPVFRCGGGGHPFTEQPHQPRRRGLGPGGQTLHH